MTETKFPFICCACNMSFEAEAYDEYDDQPCPECGEFCTPFVSAETPEVDCK
jgi:hypothetical protein